MSLDGFRIPLQEQKLEINTPFHRNVNPKITTPPESSFMTKNYSNIGYQNNLMDGNDNIDTSLSIETPIKHYDINRNLLLSPAFSSPQNSSFMNNNHYYDNQVQNTQTLPPKQHISLQQHATNQVNYPNNYGIGVSEIEKKRKKSKQKKAFDFQSSDKPPYSYATLIGLSILSHPDKRLTLSSIYSWISDTFKYYKREDVGWQNSIRHNLSLNKAFIKGEKSKDGKGHFWCIQTGFEDQFLKSRNSKNGSYHEIMEQINQNSRKRSINSIPSSPNYYDESMTRNDESMNSQMTDVDQEQSEQKYYETNETNEDDYSNKRQKLESLGEPFINSTPKQKQGNFETMKSVPFDLINSTPKLVISESPNKPFVAGKNLTFTSSFSCNSNLELSPIRPNETGPLLEPLTPGRIYKSGAINHHLSINYQNLYPSQKVEKTNINLNTIASATVSTNNHIHNYNVPQGHGHQRTNSANQSLNHLRTPKNTIKTPIRILKTPNNSAKKFWNSPNYLDDFYYSPLITSSSALHSYDDDDMILRAFESPANNKKSVERISKP